MIFMGAVDAESGTQQLQNDDEEWVDYSVHGLINHVMEKNQESKAWIWDEEERERVREAKKQNKPTSKFQVYIHILYFGFGKHKRARVLSYKPPINLAQWFIVWLKLEKKSSDSLTQIDCGIDEKSQSDLSARFILTFHGVFKKFFKNKLSIIYC